MFRLLYNLLFPAVAALATPFWLLKTHRRGGLSARLLEKVARYDADSPEETGQRRRPIYLHAVSVGEGNIARKLITYWADKHPEERFLLAMGTSTGFDLACQSPPPRTEVMYAPLDFPPFIKELFSRYHPSLIVLIEHEVWPNMMHLAEKQGVPVAIANTRLSKRSGKRLEKLKKLLGSMYHKVTWAGIQTQDDKPRVSAIGIRDEALNVVGSVKFDPALETPASTPFDPSELLDSLGTGPLLMALSTHAGEEVIFAKAASRITNARIVIIPRHMERRESIQQELNEAGFAVTLRSHEETFKSNESTIRVLVIDSTGEMPAFTKLAEVAFIGKTLTAHGGQNPCEAIAAEVPIIAGPHLENFEPLASDLRVKDGLWTVTNQEELSAALEELSQNLSKRNTQSKNALKTLEEHRGATARTVEALALIKNRA